MNNTIKKIIKNMHKNKTIIISAIVIVVVAAAAFYAGMLFAGSGKRNSQFPSQNSGVSIRGNRQGGAGFNSGEILSKDDKSITIKLMTGGSKIIFYSDTTQIGKFTSGSASDLTTGESVTVTGSPNSDGSVTAQSIQIRPAGQNTPAPQNPGQ